ncbi:MAG TPA: DUF6901 family protein [Candidatus Wunengus sp. YC60]|uniref:DUF6901 family protein n=1 Tax=Candidatus Wunengus sp. YC60 TaxID=3367697 RepID=UPI004027841D
MDKITYNLKLKDGKEYTFAVDIDRQGSQEGSSRETHSFWTKLNYNQCSNCPLQTAIHKHCPAALDLEEITEKFGDIISTERADVWVHTKNRSFFKNCDVQEALKSLFGLIMASGSCPILSRLKPLAYFHLPFAGLEETVHRLVGTYLIKQYLISGEGKCEPDWNLKGIEKLYRELEIVNVHFMNRLRDASSKDASSNALYIFVTLTSLIAMDINKMMEVLEPIVREGL